MNRFRTCLATGFIGIYVTFLAWGMIVHTLKVGSNLSPINYFAVWDMFCGWTAWDSRTHIIAEGASGRFYELREPWGEFYPFGHVARIQYDNSSYLLSSHIDHLLRHTAHEEIDQVYVVEEVWPKQYNLPPALYTHYFERPNDRLSYFHLRAVCSSDGVPINAYPDWHAQQELSAVYENPRLKRQSQQATSVYSTLFTPEAHHSKSTFRAAPGSVSTN